MVTRGAERVQAVLFDYGGVLRRDERVSAFDAIDAKLGLTPGALWSAFHDIPEYRLSREGTIDHAAYRAAVRRALLEREGRRWPRRHGAGGVRRSHRDTAAAGRRHAKIA